MKTTSSDLAIGIRHAGGKVLRKLGLRDFVAGLQGRVSSSEELRPEPAKDDWPIDAWTDPGYEPWFLANRVTEEELARQRVVRFDYEPTFSFIVPLYNTPLEYLSLMAESVLAQSYGAFELILVNASPEDEALAQAVAELCERDACVREVKLKDNFGITENTNCGIAASAGDFLCFLDHDDFIEPDTLYEYVRLLNQFPEADVLYCDEDLVEFDSAGVHFRHPLFKPAFSPELLLCKNYIVHLMAVRSSLVNQMPLPDARFDGTQDYNMVLYAAENAREVRNVEKVLYHWRMHEDSTADRPFAKPYSQRAYRLSQENHLKRVLPDAKIFFSGIANINNLWFLSKGNVPKVSVVVDCAIEETQEENFTMHDVNLDMFMESFMQINSYPNVEIVPAPSDARPRYARLNSAAMQATGDYLLFVDAGCTFLSPEPIEQLLGICSIGGVGIAAPKMYYFEGRIKSYGVAVTPERIMPLYRGYPGDFPGYQCNLYSFQDSTAAGLQGLFVSRELFQIVGGFDERFEGEIGAAEFCVRITGSGMRCALNSAVRLQTDEFCPEHPFDGQTNAMDYTYSDLLLFDEKWPGLRQMGDPYFNINLDQSSSYLQVQPQFQGRSLQDVEKEEQKQSETTVGHTVSQSESLQEYDVEDEEITTKTAQAAHAAHAVQNTKQKAAEPQDETKQEAEEDSADN